MGVAAQLWKSGWVKYLVLAALAFGVGFVGYKVLRPGKSERLVRKYFAPFEVPASNIVDPSVAHWISGVAHYQRKDYGSAKVEWERSLAGEELAPYLLGFYISQCELALEEYGAAQKSLLGVLAQQNEIHELARWYLALAYIGAEDWAEAKNLLGRMAEEDEYRQGDVRELWEVVSGQ